MTRNIVFNLLSFLSTLALGFVISPMILRELGDTRQGVWALFGELLVYLGLMDFGIRGSVSYFVGKSISIENRDDIERYTSSAFAGLLAIGVTLWAIVLGLIYVFQKELMGGYQDRIDVLGSAALFTGLFCLGLPLEVYPSALTGSHKRFLVSSSEIVSRVLSAVLMYAGLKFHPSLMILASAQVAARILYWGMNRHYARKYVPDAHVKWHLASFGTVREILNYSTKASVIDVSWLIANRKDVVLTTMFHGPAMVSTYYFARQFVTLISTACSSITQAVRPNLLHHWTRGEKDVAFGIYYTIARYSSFVVTMAAAFLIVYGRDFISLWIGSRFVTGNPLFRTDLILYTLLSGMVPRAMHSISWQMLFATKNHKSLSVMIVTESIVNFILAIVLIQKYGTLGLAFATAVPTLISNVFILPAIMRRKVGISYRRYIVEGIGPSLLVALGAAGVGLILRHGMTAATWMGVVQGGSAMGLTGLLLCYFFLLKPEHRQKLIGTVRSRIPGKLAA